MPGDAETMFVTIVDTSNSAVLTVTNVNYSASDAYSLALTAPSGIVAGHVYNVVVNKGSYAATSQQTILGYKSGERTTSILAWPGGRGSLVGRVVLLVLRLALVAQTIKLSL